MNTRPVRLPPCAAGASPTSRIRASAGPNPGTGRPQYVSSRKRATLTLACSSRQSTSRGQAKQSAISASSVGRSWAVAAAAAGSAWGIGGMLPADDPD